jgi:hypothetical protein
VVSGDKVLLGFADSWRLLNLDDGRISRLPAASQYFATGTDQLWQANAVAVRGYDAATGRAGTWHRFPAGATPMEGTSTASPHLIGLRLPGGGNGFDAVWVPGTGAITPFPSGCGPLVTANWTAADVECTGNAAALTVRDCATGASHRLGPPGGMMFDFAASGLLSPDGALMAQPVSRRSDQMEAAAGTALYDTRTGRLVKTLRLDGLVPLAWSRDSQRLVVAQVTDAFDAGSFATGNPLGYWDRSDERFSSIRVPVSGTPSVVVTR